MNSEATPRLLSITLDHSRLHRDYAAITRSVSTVRQCETRASDYVIASTDDDDDDAVFIVVDASRRVFIDRVVVVEIVNQSGALFRIASAPPIEDYDLDCVRVRFCVVFVVFVVVRIVVVEPAGRWDEKKNEGPIAVETTGGTNATEGEGGRLRE